MTKNIKKQSVKHAGATKSKEKSKPKKGNMGGCSC